jgi:hypothetical protein
VEVALDLPASWEVQLARVDGTWQGWATYTARGANATDIERRLGEGVPIGPAVTRRLCACTSEFCEEE